MLCAHVFVGLMADEARRAGYLFISLAAAAAADKSNRSLHPSIHLSRSYYLLKRCQSISLPSAPPPPVTHSVTHPAIKALCVCVCGLSLQIDDSWDDNWRGYASWRVSSAGSVTISSPILRLLWIMGFAECGKHHDPSSLRRLFLNRHLLQLGVPKFVKSVADKKVN